MGEKFAAARDNTSRQLTSNSLLNRLCIQLQLQGTLAGIQLVVPRAPEGSEVAEIGQISGWLRWLFAFMVGGERSSSNPSPLLGFLPVALPRFLIFPELLFPLFRFSDRAPDVPDGSPGSQVAIWERRAKVEAIRYESDCVWVWLLWNPVNDGYCLESGSIVVSAPAKN